MKFSYRPTTAAKKWGLGIFVFSVMGVFAGISLAATSPLELGTGIAMAVFYALLAALAFYFWASNGPSEYFEKRKLEKQRDSEAAIQAALKRLDSLSGARAVLAFEHLENLVRKAHKTGAGNKMADLLESIEFDRSRVESKFIGSVTNLGAGMFGSGTGRQVRIYKDWVIAGTSGYDFDISTRGEVTVDGSIQYDKNNRRIDNRKASLHLATQDWSHSFSILPDEADQARRLLNQLNAIVEQMKPKAVSAADMAEAMEKLMNSTGKSPAEKLEELSNLRYQRLLTDKEFELAKEKILGI